MNRYKAKVFGGGRRRLVIKQMRGFRRGPAARTKRAHDQYAHKTVNVQLNAVANTHALACAFGPRAIDTHFAVFSKFCRQRAGLYRAGEKQPLVNALFGFKRAWVRCAQSYFFICSRMAANFANGEFGSNFCSRSSRGFDAKFCGLLPPPPFLPPLPSLSSRLGPR